MNKGLTYIAGFLFVLLIVLTSFSTSQELTISGYFEKGRQAEINLVCVPEEGGALSCDVGYQCNVTSFLFPNQSVFYKDLTLTKIGSTYNLTTASNITELGIYTIAVGCTNGTSKGSNTLFYEATPSGAPPLSEGQSSISIIALIVILSVSILSFIVGFKSQSIVAKTSFITFGCIFIFVAILYTLLILNEGIAQSAVLVEGFENFYFVIKMLGWVGFASLLIIIFLVMLRAWKIKRGLID